MPVTGFAFNLMVSMTLPSPCGAVTFGGRNPASGSSVGCPVAGSMDWKRHVIRPVLVFRLALMRAIILLTGLRSKSLLNALLFG